MIKSTCDQTKPIIIQNYCKNDSVSEPLRLAKTDLCEVLNIFSTRLINTCLKKLLFEPIGDFVR